MLVRCAFIALFTLVLDQLSKWFVLEKIFKPAFGLDPLTLMEWYQSHVRLPFISLEIMPFFNLVMVWNDGIGLGMLDIAGPYMLIALSLAICAGLIFWLYRTRDAYLVLPVGLMIGGAVGNVMDRARFHAVVDFLDFHIDKWHYPAFNVADSAIVVGVIILLLQPLFTGKVKS